MSRARFPLNISWVQKPDWFKVGHYEKAKTGYENEFFARNHSLIFCQSNRELTEGAREIRARREEALRSAGIPAGPRCARLGQSARNPPDESFGERASSIQASRGKKQSKPDPPLLMGGAALQPGRNSFGFPDFFERLALANKRCFFAIH